VSLALKSCVITASYAIVVLSLDRRLREKVMRLGTGLYRRLRA
jgi:hypothetical protein